MNSPIMSYMESPSNYLNLSAGFTPIKKNIIIVRSPMPSSLFA